MRWTALIIVVQLAGCCWMSKRSCFPECPDPKPTELVKVEVPCELPPQLKLPAVTRIEQGCPAEWACYDRENAGKLALRLSAMKDWILETRKRCSPAPSSQPASQPTSLPAE
jgi:hypothetical protein